LDPRGKKGIPCAKIKNDVNTKIYPRSMIWPEDSTRSQGIEGVNDFVTAIFKWDLDKSEKKRKCQKRKQSSNNNRNSKNYNGVRQALTKLWRQKIYLVNNSSNNCVLGPRLRSNKNLIVKLVPEILH